MNEIPPLAWIAIGIIVIIFIGVNASLITLMRGGLNLPVRRPGRRASNNLQKATDAMRHPYAEEDEQLKELSNLVHGLQEKDRQDPEKRS